MVTSVSPKAGSHTGVQKKELYPGGHRIKDHKVHLITQSSHPSNSPGKDGKQNKVEGRTGHFPLPTAPSKHPSALKEHQYVPTPTSSPKKQKTESPKGEDLITHSSPQSVVKKNGADTGIGPSSFLIPSLQHPPTYDGQKFVSTLTSSPKKNALPPSAPSPRAKEVEKNRADARIGIFSFPNTQPQHPPTYDGQKFVTTPKGSTPKKQETESPKGQDGNTELLTLTEFVDLVNRRRSIPEPLPTTKIPPESEPKKIQTDKTSETRKQQPVTKIIELKIQGKTIRVAEDSKDPNDSRDYILGLEDEMIFFRACEPEEYYLRLEMKRIANYWILPSSKLDRSRDDSVVTESGTPPDEKSLTQLQKQFADIAEDASTSSLVDDL